MSDGLREKLYGLQHPSLMPTGLIQNHVHARLPLTRRHACRSSAIRCARVTNRCTDFLREYFPALPLQVWVIWTILPAPQISWPNYWVWSKTPGTVIGTLTALTCTGFPSYPVEKPRQQNWGMAYFAQGWLELLKGDHSTSHRADLSLPANATSCRM